MKRCRLSYDEWKCIISKNITGKRIRADFFQGYIGLIEIEEVNEVQIWKFNGEDMVVCDKGIKWMSILPQNDFYCITAMMNEKNEVLVWYIDMIESQGTDPDGIPYFNDLYLDLVVYPDGTIMVDDMDELEQALLQKDITQEQHDLAVDTCDKLKSGILHDISLFKKFTQRCYDVIA